MATDPNLHSRIVLWLKVSLPLAALALLSTLFLFAQKSGDPAEIPFADLNRMAEEQRVSAPRFSGVADDGSVISITADTARPVDGSIIIDTPRLVVDAADGTTLSVTAGEGKVDNSDRTATLSGLARLETSSGYTMETTSLTANLKTGVVASQGALEVLAPFGRLTAGAVTILASPDGSGQRMDFTNGVKLIYSPSNVAQDDRP